MDGWFSINVTISSRYKYMADLQRRQVARINDSQAQEAK